MKGKNNEKIYIGNHLFMYVIDSFSVMLTSKRPVRTTVRV